MTTVPAGSISLDQLRGMAAQSCAEIPGAEVRLFGSRARGASRPDADVDLLITVSDDWIAQHDRWDVLDALRWRLSEPHRPVDLLLYSQSQVQQHRLLQSHVVHQAYAEGLRLDG